MDLIKLDLEFLMNQQEIVVILHKKDSVIWSIQNKWQKELRLQE